MSRNALCLFHFPQRQLISCQTQDPDELLSQVRMKLEYKTFFAKIDQVFSEVLLVHDCVHDPREPSSGDYIMYIEFR